MTEHNRFFQLQQTPRSEKTDQEKLAYSCKAAVDLFTVGEATNWKAIPDPFQKRWLSIGYAIFKYGSSQDRSEHYQRLCQAFEHSSDKPAHDFITSAKSEFERYILRERAEQLPGMSLSAPAA